MSNVRFTKPAYSSLRVRNNTLTQRTITTLLSYSTMQPSPGLCSKANPVALEVSEPGAVDKGGEACWNDEVLPQYPWVSQRKGCNAVAVQVRESAGPEPKVPGASSAMKSTFTPNFCQQFPGKYLLPFPTQTAGAMSLKQQSSLAATVSRLPSQVHNQLGPSSRLLGEDDEPEDRDSYLMRLLRNGSRNQAQIQLQNLAPSDAATAIRGSCWPASATELQLEEQQQDQRWATELVHAEKALQAGRGDSPKESTPSPREPATHQHNNSPPIHFYGATVEVFGEAKAAELKGRVLQQQVTFTEQLFGLHQAVAVQKFLLKNIAPCPVHPQQPLAGAIAPSASRAAVAAVAAEPLEAPHVASHLVSGGADRLADPAAPLYGVSVNQGTQNIWQQVGVKRAGLPAATEQLGLPQPGSGAGSAPLPKEGAVAQPSHFNSQLPGSGSFAPPSALPPHLQWNMETGPGPLPGGSYGPSAASYGPSVPSPADPMTWWYGTHYGQPHMQQPWHMPPQLGGFQQPAPVLSPNTAAAAATAAAPLLCRQVQQAQQISQSMAGSEGVGAQGSNQKPTKWWQDPQATFGPPGDPEVVARQAPMHGNCEVDSAPSYSKGRLSAECKHKRKSMERVEEASSETTGRDTTGRAAGAGGSGAECASAFQRYMIRRKPDCPQGQGAADAPEPLPDEHAAHMLLSFSARPS